MATLASPAAAGPDPPRLTRRGAAPRPRPGAASALGERGDLVAAAPFGQVHRRVGLVEQFLAPLGVLGEAGYSDAHRERGSLGAEAGRADALADALRHRERRFAAGLHQQDDELFAAVATGDVHAAYRLLDEVRHLA